MDPVIIIGTGSAGYTLAREIRKLDKTLPLVMLTRDGGESYLKPNLSKSLADGKTADDLVMMDAAKMAASLAADIRVHTEVTAIDRNHHTITANGATLAYSKLVLASGARPFVPPIPGIDSERVVSINNLDDYRAFRDKLANSKSVAVIGAGLVGCEFAHDLAGQGYAVSVIAPDATPMATLLPAACGRALQQAMQGIGVAWRLEQGINHIDTTDDSVSLSLDNGDTITVGLVICATGLRPDTGLAEQAGLTCNRGIVVDRQLQTSDPGIYALGDCAEVEGLNLQFIMPIMHGARALAKTLSGEITAVSYPAMPVVVKTPCHPVVVMPPAPGSEGDWQVEETASGTRALFHNAAGELLGFALSGDAVEEKQALLKDVPALLP